MLFQIVYPINVPILGDSYKEAIKNYVKFNQKVNFTNLILKDQQNKNYYEARLRYYFENQKNKVGIDVYPYTNVNLPLSPVIARSALSPRNNTTVVLPPTPVIAPLGPAVTVRNSPYFATANNVVVKQPYFY
jgi:hypothetical protein